MRSSSAIAAGSRPHLVFRVDGGRSVGMGHVVRCVSLARVLRDRHNCAVSFRMNQDEVGVAWVQKQGWPVRRVAADEMNLADEGSRVDALIVDLSNSVSVEFVRGLRRANPGAVVLLMDGTCPGRLGADLVVAPVDRLPEASSWAGFEGERYQGPAYAILDPAYAELPRRLPRSAQAPRVLVTMGASDPCALTLQALRALDDMPEPLELVVAVGPAFLHESELAAWRVSARHRYEIKREDSLVDLMVNSDLGVVSFGTTVYELAVTGLPAVALSITEDHRHSAELFARFGSLVSLGLFSSVTDAAIQDAVRRILNKPSLWLEMAQRGQATVDGKGAERVADILLAKIQHERSHSEVEVGKSPRA